MLRTVIVVGCGQLGSRHLQGLANLDISVSIVAIDPNVLSLKVAQERFSEIVANPNIKDINFQTSISKVPDCIDLAVIATGADVRADVVATLIKNNRVHNIILEKFLFQRESDFARIDDLLQRRQVNAFVNCPRRIYPFYRQLKTILSGEEPITLNVAGSHWGLGSNIIHFLDLFTFLSGINFFKIDDVSLDNTILQSKRPNFVEFTGTLKGSNVRGDRFEITSSIKPGSALRVSIEARTQKIEIQESSGKVLFINKATGTERQESFAAPYQSQLTGSVAKELIMNGVCHLTTYHESMQSHLLILKTFLDHLNSVSDQKYKYCPIT